MYYFSKLIICLCLFPVFPLVSTVWISPSYASALPSAQESNTGVRSTGDPPKQLTQNRQGDRHQERFGQSQPIPPSVPPESNPPGGSEPEPVSPTSAPGSTGIQVEKIVVTGNTIFEAQINSIIQPLEGQTVTLEKLQEAADQITQLYLNQGFLTSRAVLDEKSLPTGAIAIEVIEGELEEIEIEGTRRLNPGYIRSRVELGAGKPLNIANLEDQLRLLRTNPLFESVEATLRSGTEVGKRILVVRVIETDPYKESRRNTRQVSDRVKDPICVKPALIYAVFTPATVATGEEQPELPTDQLDLALVTATGKPIRLTVPGATREQVLAVAKQLYDRVSNRRSNYLEPAQQMYQWLVAPLEEQLQAQEIENLLFIMDEGLRLVPVAALHDGNQFVAQRYSSGLSPSLSLTDTLYRDIRGLPVLAMGASEFTPDQNQQPLPAVEIEVPEIAGQIREGESFINQQFTVDNLKSSLQQTSFGIVHLATHADFQPGDVSKSYIQLFNSKLGLDEVRQLGLNKPLVELLVISACRSAYGNREAELGFGGLAVQAGVKSALASLWYVGDTGTLALMTEFYDQLETAPIKAEALRRVQVAMIEGRVRKEGGQIVRIRGPLELPPEAATGEEDLSHPYYWAAFTLIGNPW